MEFNLLFGIPASLYKPTPYGAWALARVPSTKHLNPASQPKPPPLLRVRLPRTQAPKQHSPLLHLPSENAKTNSVSDTSLNQQDAPRSPFAGCLILIVMAIVVIILIASAGYSIKKQTDSVKTFTEEEAKPAPIADLSNHEPELNSLMNRIRHFDHEIQNSRPAQLELTPTEVNYTFAHFEVFKNFRGQLFFNDFTDSQITGNIHYPLNSTKNLPKFVRDTLNIETRDNNINGTFIGTPLLTDGKLILNLSEIKPERGQIPEALFSNISRTLISGELEKQLEDDPKNPPALLTKLKKLTSLTLKDGKLCLAYTPGETPPSIKEESDAMATKAKQLVALGAIIFILTMILLFIVLSRRQRAKREAAGHV